MRLLFLIPAVFVALVTYLATKPLLRTIKERKKAGTGNWYHLSRWVQIIWLFGGVITIALTLPLLMP